MYEWRGEGRGGRWGLCFLGCGVADGLEAAELFAGVGGAVGAVEAVKLDGQALPLGGVKPAFVKEAVFKILGGLGKLPDQDLQPALKLFTSGSGAVGATCALEADRQPLPLVRVQMVLMVKGGLQLQLFTRQ